MCIYKGTCNIYKELQRETANDSEETQNNHKEKHRDSKVTTKRHQRPERVCARGPSSVHA